MPAIKELHPITNKSKTKLPCGCVRGEYLCHRAEQLWHATNITYQMCKNGQLSWTRYNEMCKKIDAHLRGEQA